MPKNQPPKAPGAPQAAGGQDVDVDSIIARVEASIPAQLKDIYGRAVLSGMRIMFSSSSHQMTLDALNQPGPLATRISNGIIQLMYILWTKSNKTLPPQIIVPVTLTLTLQAFKYLQESNDPGATKDVLGEATSEAVEGVMSRFGATPDKLPELVKAAAGRGAPAPQAGQAQAAPAPAPAPAAPQPTGGMIGAAAKKGM